MTWPRRDVLTPAWLDLMCASPSKAYGQIRVPSKRLCEFTCWRKFAGDRAEDGYQRLRRTMFLGHYGAMFDAPGLYCIFGRPSMFSLFIFPHTQPAK